MREIKCITTVQYLKLLNQENIVKTLILNLSRTVYF